MSESTELQAGSMIREYELIRLLGEGPFSQVWQAHHEDEGEETPYAIKIATHPMYARWLADHETFALDIDHPNLWLANEIDVGHSPPYLVSDLIPGQSLKEICEAGHRYPVLAALEVLRQIASALEALHGVGEFHGELAPNNVLVAESGDVMLLDTETGRITRDISLFNLRTSKNNPPAAIAALLPYLSPEDRGMPGRTDMRGDVFSFGIICYQLVTHQTPTTDEITKAELKQVPRCLRTFILDCLAEESSRMASGNEVLRRLGQVIDELEEIEAEREEEEKEEEDEEEYEYEVDDDDDDEYEYEVDDDDDD